jgi:hypothetical protein
LAQLGQVFLGDDMMAAHGAAFSANLLADLRNGPVLALQDGLARAAPWFAGCGAPVRRAAAAPRQTAGYRRRVARWAALPSLTGTPLQLNVGGRSHDSSVNSYHKDYWLREELSTNNAFPPCNGDLRP